MCMVDLKWVGGLLLGTALAGSTSYAATACRLEVAEDGRGRCTPSENVSKKETAVLRELSASTRIVKGSHTYAAIGTYTISTTDGQWELSSDHVIAQKIVGIKANLVLGPGASLKRDLRVQYTLMCKINFVAEPRVKYVVVRKVASDGTLRAMIQDKKTSKNVGECRTPAFPYEP